MVSKKSEQISECLARAADARACAAETTDPARKADLLDIEHCWMQVAKSYRSVDRQAAFWMMRRAILSQRRPLVEI